MFDHETHLMIARDRAEQLRATALTPSTPLRLTLGDWLIRLGMRLLPECPERERSALAHKALASRGD